MSRETDKLEEHDRWTETMISQLGERVGKLETQLAEALNQLADALTNIRSQPRPSEAGDSVS